MSDFIQGQKLRAGAWLGAMILLFGLGCGDGGNDISVDEPTSVAGFEVQDQQYADSVDGPHADHHAMHAVTIYDAEAAGRYFDAEGAGSFEYPDAFQQVGMRLQAEEVEELSFRAELSDGNWTNWEPVDVYWSEGNLHNALILIDEPTTAIELRGGGSIEFAQIEFFPEIVARGDLIRSGDAGHGAEALDTDEPSRGEDIATTQQAVAPSSLVTSRAQWGATNPNKICGSIVAPYRMSIHHTAVPSSDGNLYATMRGMQNYHMNNNGWCDIGYHFVVAQSGEILQGRSRSNRPGAHVGGQNSGNVGISMIGNYSSATPPQVQRNSTGDIVRWVHQTHNVPLNRTAIKGHREWPNQWTSCPGDQGLSRINEIINIAANGGTPPPPPPPEYDVDLKIVINGLDDFYQQGTSNSVPDAFEGQRFTAEIRVTNLSDAPIRGVEVGYAIDTPGLVATSYRIDTDHPAYNQSSWQLNDANDAPSNPDSSNMGSQGVLTMHAFSPDETKRVFIELEAQQYNIGFGDFAGIRSWVRNIDDVYAQTNYGSSPSTNNLGYALREEGRVDVMSRAEWQFQAGAANDLEGWTADGPYDRLAINTSHDLLAFKVEGPGASVTSPTWTQIDADRFDELVIRARSHDGDHIMAIYWAREGESFDEARAVRFESPGDSEYHTLVVAVGEHPEWSGQINRLRLVLNDNLDTAEEDSGWYDVDHLYFQNRQSGQTSSHTLGVVDKESVEVDLGQGAPTEPGTGSDKPRVPGASGEHDDSGTADPGLDDAEGYVVTNTGCSMTGSDEGPGATWLLLMLAMATVLAGRRRREADGS